MVKSRIFSATAILLMLIIPLWDCFSLRQWHFCSYYGHHNTIFLLIAVKTGVNFLFLEIAVNHKSVMAFVAVKRPTLRFTQHQTTTVATVSAAMFNITIREIALFSIISVLIGTFRKIASDLITYFWYWWARALARLAFVHLPRDLRLREKWGVACNYADRFPT